MKRTQDSLDSKQVLSVIESYSTALDLLDDYDHQTMKRPKGSDAAYVLTYEECRKVIDSMRFKSESELFGQEKDGMDYIYFKRLMLDEKYQGMGLGRASMVAALDYFREEYPTAGFVELMHYMDNDTGASLYESVGFESTGEVRRTLRPGSEDEYDEEIVRRKYY